MPRYEVTAERQYVTEMELPDDEELWEQAQELLEDDPDKWVDGPTKFSWVELPDEEEDDDGDGN